MSEDKKIKPANNFQEHLADLDKRGLLVTIDQPINKDTEMQPLVRWQFVGGLPEEQRKAFFVHPCRRFKRQAIRHACVNWSLCIIR